MLFRYHFDLVVYIIAILCKEKERKKKRETREDDEVTTHSYTHPYTHSHIICTKVFLNGRDMMTSSINYFESLITSSHTYRIAISQNKKFIAAKKSTLAFASHRIAVRKRFAFPHTDDSNVKGRSFKLTYCSFD